ncbi:MAG: gfo/Idh/MocA family oxidoreductase, partial [Chitinophagaceae bacterium]|nr:gfo/Idh/MocA family oxidoreductase [Chitinophagaceae bacterium]
GTYAANPRLLPTTRTEKVKVKQRMVRVPDSTNGHYAQWVEACIAGYGNKEVSSPFETAGPLTEALLMANLAIKAYDIRKPKATGKGFDYPGRYIKLLWDNDNMKVTNFDDVNKFVKREYPKGFSLNL